MYGLLFSAPVDLQEKSIRKYHYCSLCNALGRGYGHQFRYLTNHDATYLSMLTAAQMNVESMLQSPRCALRGRAVSRTEQEYSSAVSLMMAKTKLLDDYYDGRSRLASVKLALMGKAVGKAEACLAGLGFPYEIFEEEVRRQHLLERRWPGASLEDLCAPTEEIVSSLFRHTAVLSRRRENAGVLSEIGRDVGALMYVMDSYSDVGEDGKRGSFNPLLSCEGIWPTSRRRLGRLKSFSKDFARGRLERIRENCARLNLDNNARLTLSTLTTDLQRRIDSIIEFANQPRNRFYMMSLVFPAVYLLYPNVGQSGECDDCCPCDICMTDCEAEIQSTYDYITDSLITAGAATAGGAIAAGAANSVVNSLTGGDKPEEPPEDEPEDDRDEDQDQQYVLELTCDKTSVKGNGTEGCTFRATVRGSDGSARNASFSYSYGPGSAGTLTASGPEARFQSSFVLNDETVTVSCIATVTRDSWMGTGGPSVQVGPATKTIRVIGAKPRLDLKANPKSIKADGRTLIIIEALLYLFEGEALPEALLFDLAEVAYGELTGKQVKTITFKPKYTPSDKRVTVTATADVRLPDGSLHKVSGSVGISLIGGHPKFKLTASPVEVVSDGKNFVTISAECEIFGEPVKVKLDFHPHDMGVFLKLLDMSVKFRPHFTPEDDKAVVLANTTVSVPSAPQGVFLEVSTPVTLRSARLELKATPEEVDGDEVSQVRLELDPDNVTSRFNLSLRAEPSDSGKFTGVQPPTSFIPNLTENDKDVTIVVTLDSGVKRFERDKTIKVIGASPRLELRADQASARGDGETRLRIDNNVTLFGKLADEGRLQQLNAQVEWEERSSGKSLGDFEDKHLTYAYFVPKPSLEDGETTLVAKLTLVSKETGLRIEEESDPLRIKIEGAYPKLKLEAEPEVIPGDPGKSSEVEAKLVMFGEERAIPEDEEVDFSLVDPQLGVLERLEPSVTSFKPKFLARDRDTAKAEQEEKVKGSMDVEASKLFPGSKEKLEQRVHVEGETDIRILGCLVKILEPEANASMKANKGKLFDVKARVTTPDGESVPEVDVRVTFEDKTKDPAVTTTQRGETSSDGEAIVGFNYSGLEKSRNGTITVTAEITGAKGARDWDQVTVSVSKAEEALRMELNSEPDRIPGTPRTVSAERIESKVEAKLIGPSGALEMPAGKQVEFKVLDEELGGLEDPKPTSVAFRPKFMAKDKDGGVQERMVSVQGNLEFTMKEARKLVPSYSGASEVETVRLEEKTEVTLEGCIVKITEPEEESTYTAKDGKLFDVKAKVTTLAAEGAEGDPIPEIDVKFTFEDRTKESPEPVEETKTTDGEGVAEIEYNFTGAEESRDGEIIIKAEIRGAKNSLDYDEKKVMVAKIPELTLTAYVARVFEKEGGEPDKTYDPERYKVTRTIKLEVEESE
ncbi:MAG TPA: DUF5685 family protein [Patescibacteria group bacterium]|nr:DUF5685 family protein [Patescibacteria group bacterium]